MDEIKNKIKQAAMELRICVFCAILVVLSIVFMTIEPGAGVLIYRVSVATFCVSLLIFSYKFVFGKITGFLLAILFISIYVAAIGYALQNYVVVKAGIVVALVSIATKAFYWLFVSKTTIESTGEDEDLPDVPEKESNVGRGILFGLILVLAIIGGLYAYNTFGTDIVQSFIGGGIKNNESAFSETNTQQQNMSSRETSDDKTSAATPTQIQQNATLNDNRQIAQNNADIKQNLANVSANSRMQYKVFKNDAVGYSFEYPTNASVDKIDAIGLHCKLNPKVEVSVGMDKGYSYSLKDMEQNIRAIKEESRIYNGNILTVSRLSENSLLWTGVDKWGNKYIRKAYFLMNSEEARVIMYDMMIYCNGNDYDLDSDPKTKEIVEYMLDSYKLQ